MNRRLMTRLMKQNFNVVSSPGNFYFRPDFEHVLQGLCFEHTPRGVYVSIISFPLFDFFGINLTFSTRLRSGGGFIANGSMTEEAVVDFVMASPEARSVFARSLPLNLPAFIHDIESLSYDWQSTRITLIYITAMLLTGHDVRTDRLFQTFPAHSILGNRDLSAWNQLRTKLQEGLEPAKALLEQVRYENIRALGLADPA